MSPSIRVDNALNSIKGGGACQLREKVLAEAADTCVRDTSRQADLRGSSPDHLPFSQLDYRRRLPQELGGPRHFGWWLCCFYTLSPSLADACRLCRASPLQWTQGVPIEVAPFAYSPVLLALEKLGATSCGLRMAKMKAGPVVTDNGNFNIDAVFPESSYRDPAKVGHRCRRSPDNFYCVLTHYNPPPNHLAASSRHQAADRCRRGRPLCRPRQGGVLW